MRERGLKKGLHLGEDFFAEEDVRMSAGEAAVKAFSREMVGFLPDFQIITGAEDGEFLFSGMKEREPMNGGIRRAAQVGKDAGKFSDGGKEGACQPGHVRAAVRRNDHQDFPDGVFRPGVPESRCRSDDNSAETVRHQHDFSFSSVFLFTEFIEETGEILPVSADVFQTCGVVVDDSFPSLCRKMARHRIKDVPGKEKSVNEHDKIGFRFFFVFFFLRFSVPAPGREEAFQNG